MNISYENEFYGSLENVEAGIDDCVREIEMGRKYPGLQVDLQRASERLSEFREVWRFEGAEIWKRWPQIDDDDDAKWRCLCDYRLARQGFHDGTVSRADKAAWIAREKKHARSERHLLAKEAEDRASREKYQKKMRRNDKLRDGWPFLTEAEFSRWAKFYVEMYSSLDQDPPTVEGLREDLLDAREHQFEAAHGAKVNWRNRSKFEKWVRHRIQDREVR